MRMLGLTEWGRRPALELPKRECWSFFLSAKRSPHTDPYGVPVPADVVDVDVDQVEHVEGVIIDNSWRALVDDCAPVCHATLHATIAGTTHVVVIGKFDDLDDAITETDTFSQWLVGVSLLDVTDAQLNTLVDTQPRPALAT